MSEEQKSLTENKEDSIEFELEENRKEEEAKENSKIKKESNAKLKEPIDFIIPNDYKFNYTISLPSINLTDFTQKVKEHNNLNLDSKNPKLQEWKKVNEDAVDYYTTGNLYSSRFTDDNSLFLQGVEKDNELKNISTLKFKKSEGELKGELAILKVSKLLGLGEVINVPLPHSGIWVIIKPPTEKDLIDFYNSLFRDKVILGRATFGLTLSNFSVYIQNKLFDFIINHIQSVNYSDIPKEELKNYILISDLPILAWGFACTIYPNGFEYTRACVKNPEECTYIYKGLINLTKLLWIDNLSLSDYQKSVLFENRPNKLTLENYKKYIAEHNRVTGYEFTIKNDIKIKLKTPTVAEYFADGLNWINSINNKINSLIIEEGNEEEIKTDLLNSYVKSSILRKLSHYIDYIEIEENIVNDRETINSVLEVFSSDDDIRPNIENEIIKYKEKSIIALIGIPEFKCPNCGSYQNTEIVNENFTKVIPLDVLNLFFTLITLRIAKILERNV